MCGRFAFYSPAEASAALFGVVEAAEVEPRYNIAPTQYVAAVRDSADAAREQVMLRWGLVPFWAKDPAIGNRMINARAETVAEKPSFRAAFRHRRCVVLADGFYEWRRQTDGKTPYFISRHDGASFGLAALWESWTDPETGNALETTALLTRQANEYMSGLHHRMPVMLTPDAADEWLANGEDYLHKAEACMPALRAWPVSRRVNNARNDEENLVVAVGETLD